MNGFERRSIDNKKLAILVHGFHSTKESFKPLCNDCIGNEFDVHIPDMPYKSFFSRRSSKEIVSKLKNQIRELHKLYNYDEIILVGHSFGAQIVRALYCSTWQDKDPDGEKHNWYRLNPKDKWIENVKRVIYISGFHRGWSKETIINRQTKIGITAANFIGNMISFFDWMLKPFVFVPRITPTIFDAKFGAQSLVRLRLKVLRLNQFLAEKNKFKSPITIQVLGTRDDMVKPVTQIDATPDAKTYIAEIHGSGHTDILKTPNAQDWSDEDQISSSHAEERKRVFGVILHATEEQLSDWDDDQIFTTDEYDFEEQKPLVTDVVFIVHGIRDLAYWTPKLARKIKSIAKSRTSHSNRVVECATPTYGYFPIVDFLMPYLRRNKVSWLADRYVSLKAKYPDADIHYIGHSNGTQIFCEAIQKYPEFKFKNVVFAGSVVRRNFPWRLHIDKNVHRLRNYIASGDLVVALFPKALQWSPFFNLGSGGHDGFNSLHEKIENIAYVSGAHGAAIQDDVWDDIAGFILDGSECRLKPPVLVKQQKPVIKTVGIMSGALVLLAAFLFIATPLFGILTWILNRTYNNDVISVRNCESVQLTGTDTFLSIWGKAPWNCHLATLTNQTIALPIAALILFSGLLYWIGKKF